MSLPEAGLRSPISCGPSAAATRSSTSTPSECLTCCAPACGPCTRLRWRCAAAVWPVYVDDGMFGSHGRESAAPPLSGVGQVLDAFLTELVIGTTPHVHVNSVTETPVRQIRSKWWSAIGLVRLAPTISNYVLRYSLPLHFRTFLRAIINGNLCFLSNFTHFSQMSILQGICCASKKSRLVPFETAGNYIDELNSPVYFPWFDFFIFLQPKFFWYFPLFVKHHSGIVPPCCWHPLSMTRTWHPPVDDTIFVMYSRFASKTRPCYWHPPCWWRISAIFDTPCRWCVCPVNDKGGGRTVTPHSP